MDPGKDPADHAFDTALDSIMRVHPPVDGQAVVDVANAGLAARHNKHVVYRLERLATSSKCRTPGHRLTLLRVIDSILQAAKDEGKEVFFVPVLARNLLPTIKGIMSTDGGGTGEADRHVHAVLQVVNLWDEFFPEGVIDPVLKYLRAMRDRGDKENVAPARVGRVMRASPLRQQQQESGSLDANGDLAAIKLLLTAPDTTQLIHNLNSYMTELPQFGAIWLETAHEVVCDHIARKLSEEKKERATISTLLEKNFNYSDDEEENEHAADTRKTTTPLQGLDREKIWSIARAVVQSTDLCDEVQRLVDHRQPRLQLPDAGLPPAAITLRNGGPVDPRRPPTANQAPDSSPLAHCSQTTSVSLPPPHPANTSSGQRQRVPLHHKEHRRLDTQDSSRDPPPGRRDEEKSRRRDGRDADRDGGGGMRTGYREGGSRKCSWTAPRTNTQEMYGKQESWRNIPQSIPTVDHPPSRIESQLSDKELVELIEERSAAFGVLISLDPVISETAKQLVSSRLTALMGTVGRPVGWGRAPLLESARKMLADMDIVGEVHEERRRQLQQDTADRRQAVHAPAQPVVDERVQALHSIDFGENELPVDEGGADCEESRDKRKEGKRKGSRYDKGTQGTYKKRRDDGGRDANA